MVTPIKMKKPPKTAKQKKMTKLVTEIHNRDINPTDNRTDRAIARQIGYSDSTKMKEIFGSKCYLEQHNLFYRNKKTPDELATQLAAKARRNVFNGLDNDDEKIKLEYTKMQFNQEDKEANRTKLEMKDAHGNMMTLLGSAATDALQIKGITTNITEVEDIEEGADYIHQTE